MNTTAAEAVAVTEEIATRLDPPPTELTARAQDTVRAAVSYPEHEKLQAIQRQSQAIGEFLEWLPTSRRGLVIARQAAESDRWYPAFVPIVELLAEYFGIDLAAMENEKRSMLASLAEGAG